MKKIYIIILIVLIPLLSILLLYLNFTKYNFTLNGEEIINLNINDIWTDPGYTLTKGNKVYNDNVNVISNLDLNTKGEYEIKYTYKSFPFSKTIIRKITVNVTNSDLVFNLVDNNEYYLLKDNIYNEPGYQVIDKVDGDITSKVIVNSNVNNENIGDYEIKYSITNSQNVTKELIRKVKVYDFDVILNLEKKELSTSNSIIFNTSSSYFNYVILPDNTKDSNNNVTFPVNENGTYEFNVFDKYGNSKKYNIEVNNIDNIKPTGTCEYYLYDTNGEIKVEASDNNNILNYVYKYGNSTSSKVEENVFKVNTMDEDARVILYDSVGNINEIVCQNVDKTTKIPSSYQTHYHKGGDSETSFNYWLYLPKDNNKRKTIPLLLYFHGDGGKGSDPNLVNNYAYPNFIKNGMDFPFAMVAPQVTKGDSFYNTYYQNGVYKMLQELINEYNIDENRIIVAGGSSGADGAYRAISLHSEMFSCGVIGSGTIYTIDQVGPEKLTKIPMWFFHGEKDTALSHTAMEGRIEKIKSLGGQIKYTLIPNGTHEITETVFKREDLIAWMLEQQRK